MKKRISVKKLVLLSLFTALSVIITKYASPMLFNNTVRFGLGGVPIVFSGIVLGPMSGAVVGLASDLLGVLIYPQGAFHPGFSISSILTGVIPGLVIMFYKKKNLQAIATSYILIYFIVSLMLNTYWLSQLQGRAYIVILPLRIASQGIITITSIIITQILIKATKKTNLL